MLYYLSELTRLFTPLNLFRYVTFRALMGAGTAFFLSLLLVTGAVWAEETWGRWWGWDPKETWALITFLVYSIYLHVRLARGWNGTWEVLEHVRKIFVTTQS